MTYRPRLPKQDDFPSSYKLSIIPPKGTTSTAVVTSVLLLLHGLGDSEAPFTNLARSFALPATVGIAIRAPHPIPSFLTGSDTPSLHWSDDLLFDEQTGAIDGDAGFTRAMNCLDDIVTILVNSCQFEERDVWILGFGQGAQVGLGWVMRAERGIISTKSKEKLNCGGFGGIVAIGGGLPKESLSWIPSLQTVPQTAASEKLKTPVLLCGGNSHTQVTQRVVSAIQDRFANVQYVKWHREGDEMPRSRAEILPIMEFFARRLRSRVGVPNDAVEL